MAEITTTQSFSDGDTVTATKLNNIQANASLQLDAITNRTAETTIDQANDLLLIYDASATSLKKVTPSDLIKSGTASNFPITGNATIGGTLDVTGTSALTGNTTIGGTLGVTGASTLTGNTAVGGTLAVTGAITATSTINGTTIPATKTLVTTVDTQTLTNKTLTTPVISSISNSGTLTLPTATDTLVGRATTDTLTNKTLTSPAISTISNTGTLTLPTSTDTLVGRATTDTLTNKTITSPTISGGTINSAVIGGTTALAGSFTTINASGVITATAGVTGNVTGNVSGTVTNGVVTTGTYSDPAWITTLAKSKVGLGSVPNTDCTNASNISSGTLGLARLGTLSTGQVLAGNAGTATATTLSGDATIGATGIITLANSGVASGTYGSSSLIPAITIDAKGRITSATNTSFSTTPADGVITFAKLSTSATEASNTAKRVAKAWVNFNGTGTPAIQTAFNVSSIGDNGVGKYTINFNSSLSGGRYCAVGMAGDTSVSFPRLVGFSNNGTPSASALPITVCDVNATADDVAYICVSVFE